MNSEHKISSDKSRAYKQDPTVRIFYFQVRTVSGTVHLDIGGTESVRYQHSTGAAQNGTILVPPSPFYLFQQVHPSKIRFNSWKDVY